MNVGIVYNLYIITIFEIVQISNVSVEFSHGSEYYGGGGAQMNACASHMIAYNEHFLIDN